MVWRQVPRLVSFLRKVTAEAAEDDIFTMAAAVAFYTCLSLAPLVVLLVWISGFMGPDAQDALTDEFRDVIGFQGAEAVAEIVERAREERPHFGDSMGLIGLFVLIYAATRVFVQFQFSMNTIWDVEVKTGRGAIWDWFQKRLLSMAMIATLAFLLLVSLVLDTAIELVAVQAAELVPNLAFARLANLTVSLVIFVLIFAGIFKYVPDVRIEWRDVWFGATITALLFIVGRGLLGIYLTRLSFTSAYGAAGAFVVLLLWVYYSVFTAFVGAEMTQVWSRRGGRGLEPALPAEINEENAHRAAEDFPEDESGA